MASHQTRMNSQSKSTIRILHAIAKASGGKARYYEHVDVLTLNGVPVVPDMSYFDYERLFWYSTKVIGIHIKDMTITVVLNDDNQSIVKFTPFTKSVRVYGDNLLKFNAFGYIHRHEFIETLTAKYYDRYTLELYTEHFELAGQMFTTSSFMLPINSFVQFATFTVAENFIIDHEQERGDLTRDGNYIYINKQKYAISVRALGYNSGAILKSGWESIYARNIFEYEINFKKVPKNLINIEICRSAFLYQGQYLGETETGEIICLYPRSENENSGSRTKPAIREAYAYDSAE